jgi:O-antigen ligase
LSLPVQKGFALRGNTEDRPSQSLVVAIAVALPFLLIHPNHLPVIASRGSLEIRPSDLMILVVVGLAAFDARRRLDVRIRRWLWFGPLLVILFASALAAPDAGHVAVAVAKLVEYFAFGVAVTLVLDDVSAARLIILVLGAWAAVLGIVGAAEIAGAHRISSVRAQSLTGIDPLGLIGAAVLILALAAPHLIGLRRVRLAIGAAGFVCLLLAASLSATVGLALATSYAVIRRLGAFARFNRVSMAAFATVIVTVAVAFVVLRWSDIRATTQLSGTPARPQSAGPFVQRAMFADFGVRMWLDHPLFGVGFQQSPRLDNWAPYFASVRSDFSGLPPWYFPAVPEVSFGLPASSSQLSLHNLYSQLLAETGLVGLLCFFLGFVGAAGPAFRRARDSEVACAGALLVLLVLGAYTRNQFYGGLPETTILVLALAFAISGGSALTRRGERR